MYIFIFNGINEMLLTIKQWIYSIVAVVVLVLTGAFAYQKRRADKKEEEIQDLEKEVKYQEEKHKVDSFEAVNVEKKVKVDEEIKHKDDDRTPRPNTSYSL